MQAMGYYPSEHEIENMLNEVKYSSLSEGELIDSISFPDLIKLYINHKPVFDYSEQDLLEALGKAVQCMPGLPSDEKSLAFAPTTMLSKEGLYSLLQQHGESMSKEDLQTSFRALLLNDPVYNGVLPDNFTGRQFVEELLGLQPAIAGGGTYDAAEATE
ncbi:Cilia- and flagella-associated protein 251 [Physocladia obscura]|uniref:Cilia- and flagella-associated protein 251 n=1 Tax=Physocladia obscura TaxID=109957 RepID=A0AAD5X7R0_9FUNG|nr:Cilia- and flagella-associated protein 251 [Physocladia obscura]